MDIKEIALRLLAKEFPGMHQENQAFMVEFAEALIESYKAELLNEAGEPVAVTNHAQLGYVTDGMHPDIPLAMWAKETSYSGANIALFTSDQVVAAVLKATKPLEEEVEFQRTAHNRAMEMMLEQGAQLAAAQEEMNGWRNQASQLIQANERNMVLDEGFQKYRRQTDLAYMGSELDTLNKLAASQAYAEQLREALCQWVGIASNCSIESGVCCCGESIENHSHPMACGHSPVDMADSAVHGAIDKTDKALALPRDTSALDAYVEQKVKETMK